jgi:hypothetical protein
MAVITTGTHPKELWPGVHSFFGKSYKEKPLQCMNVFDKNTSTKKYEEDVESTSFGLAPIKSEGASIAYDSDSQGPTTRYTHITYGLGYIVTREQLEDGQYREVSMKRAKQLAFSMRSTKETVAANVFNRAFNSSYLGGDGKEMIATDHPTLDGTQSNELSPAADLSEAAIESMLIQISNAKNSRGLRIDLQGRKLIIPVDYQFEAHRILNSVLRVGTANNDINAMRAMGMLPDGVCTWNYLTDTDAFFIKTDAPDGLNMFQRRAMEFKQDNDFDTENAKAKATERFSFGWSEWRAIFGSTGS